MEYPLLPLLPGPLWLEVVVPAKVLFMGQIELFNLSYTWNHLTVYKQMTDVKLLVFNRNPCKQMSSGLFKNNVTYKLFIYKSYIYIYIYIYISKVGDHSRG